MQSLVSDKTRLHLKLFLFECQIKYIAPFFCCFCEGNIVDVRFSSFEKPSVCEGQ